MKYLVMECHKDYAVLLDEEAVFVKAVNTGLTVGETIENPRFLKSTEFRRNIIMKVTSGIAAAAACLAVVFGINHYNEYMKPYSNIRMSINPDVEIVLNHHGQVLSVKGLNDDGEMLVEGYNPKRQDKIMVADELIERAIDMGFLSDDAIIIFDIDTPDKELLTQYGVELKSEAEIYTRQFDNVNIVIIDRNEDAEYEYDDEDYEPIVIPIPQHTDQTGTPEIMPDSSDSGYEENYDGDSNYDTDDGMSDYGGNVTAAPATVPAATEPPVTQAPTAAPVYNDSAYGDSAYGDSLYD